MRAWLGADLKRRVLPLAAVLTIVILIVAAGFATVRVATNRLLESEARADAQSWVNYLALGIPELPMIAKGARPSESTRHHIAQARTFNRVFSFRVYDQEGYLTFRSDGTEGPAGTRPSMAMTDPAHVSVLRGEEPKTEVRHGSAAGEPTYYSSTALAILDGDKQVGWIVANIDQTERQAAFFRMASIVSLAIGLMLMTVPLLVLWQRTRQKQDAERRLHDLARRDITTGLENRQTFLDGLEIMMLQSRGNHQRDALIICELSGTHAVSQTYGATAVDKVIRTSATRLAELAPAGASLSRLDPDRFGIALPAIKDPMEILSFTKELTVKLSAPINHRDQDITVSAHAGIALSQSDGIDAESLMHSAELALRSAQEQGSPGYGFFNPEIAQDARRRVAVQRAVAEAAASNAFRLDFQPLYHIRSGELSGFEALIRLNDPELGPVSPAEFIPIAEQTGLINKIGAWCLNEACRVASEWPAHLVVAVNLSPSQFYSGTLISDVQHALTANRYPSYRLELEITEGTLLKDSELVLQQLSTLRETGVAIALDDFGTGYSSLSYLWKFPFSKLKIDRSFVMALDESQSAKGILRSIIKLGHGLGLTVTAEGIETLKQFSTLRELGCDLAQGYLLDRPSRIEDLAAIIMRNFAKGLQRRPSRHSDDRADADVIPLRNTSNG